MTIGIYAAHLTKRKPVSTVGCQVGVTNGKKAHFDDLPAPSDWRYLQGGVRVQFAPIERLFLIIVSVV
jgi:hypothetical protein